MKIDWENELSYDMYIRLCECRNKKSDIVPMARVIKKVMNMNSKEALDYMLEWVCDWNSQISLYPKSDLAYNRMLAQLERVA
jgi:hypothetical protein